MTTRFGPRWCVAVWVVGLLSLASLAAAQSYQGGMRGSVKDAQGVIPGATVTITNDGTGVSRDTVTNDSGGYSFPALDGGTYTVKASVAGFKTFERKGIRIATQTFVTLDITLEVGTLEETITVTADAPLLETSNASHADVLDAATLEVLPSAGRNVFLMAVTVPTVQSSGDTHWNRMQDQSGSSTLSMGGGGVRSNNYLLDGFPTTDLVNRSAVNPSSEMVEDVRVQVHTYDAEMGRTGGGVLNTTAKSGSNQWRGSAFYLNRPASLVGPNFFNEIRGLPTNDAYWKNAGGGFGGPILRNKTFFWAAGEVYEDVQSQNAGLRFPTAAMRGGDFSQVTDLQGRPMIIYDPLTTDAAGNRQPFPGNIIPANRINPVGRALMAALPMPSINLDNGSVNFPAQDALKNKARQGSLKIDHTVNGSISLNGVYLYQKSSEPDANYFPDAPYAAPSYQLERTVNMFVLNNTYILNSNTVATLRFGMNSFADDYILPFDFDTHQLGWNPAFANAIPVQKFPSLSFTGYSGTGFSGQSDSTYYSWGVNGALTRLAGSHSFKTGADYRILGIDSLSRGASAGTYTFNGQFTGSNASNPSATSRNSIADLMLGYPSSGSITLTSRFDDFVKYYGFFVQDDWRATEKLTVNFGVRLEHETGLAEKNNQLAVGFDRGAVSPLNVTIPADAAAGTPARQVMGGLVFAGQNGANDYVGNPPAVKLSPRVGVAYAMNPETVIRGGYGLFWAPWQSGVQQPSGYAQATSLEQDTLRPITSISDPFPNGLTQITGNAAGLLTGASTSITFIDPDRTAPKVHQYSVDLQRQLPRDSSIGFTYMGASGRDLTWGGTGSGAVNINQVDPKYLGLNNPGGTNLLTQLVANPFNGVAGAGSFATRGASIQRNQLLRPFPQYGDINMIYSTHAKSQYHAAVVQVNKRATGWWGGRMSYTWSRLTDNQFGQGNYYTSAPGILNHLTAVPWSEYYNPDAEFGRSLLDSPHKLVASPIIRLPFGDGQRWLTSGIGNAIAGGWTLSFVIQMQSGFPIGVTQSVNNTNLLGHGQRPNVVSGVELLVPGSITDRLRKNPSDDLYLNPLAVSQAVSGTIGNSPRIADGVYSPWRNSTDMGINKDFRLGGARRATLRLEIINLFDNPWFAALSSVSQGNSNFGRITAQGNYSRTMQVTGRFSF